MIPKKKKRSSGKVEFPSGRAKYMRRESDVTADELKLLFSLHELIRDYQSLDARFRELKTLRQGIVTDRELYDTLLGREFYQLFTRLECSVYSKAHGYSEDCDKLQEVYDYIKSIFLQCQEEDRGNK